MLSLMMETQIEDFHHENTDYLITMVISLQTVLLVVLIHKQTPVFPISITSLIILSTLGVSKTRTYNFLMTFIAIIIKKSIKPSERYALFPSKTCSELRHTVDITQVDQQLSGVDCFKSYMMI